MVRVLILLARHTTRIIQTKRERESLQTERPYHSYFQFIICFWFCIQFWVTKQKICERQKNRTQKYRNKIQNLI